MFCFSWQQTFMPCQEISHLHDSATKHSLGKHKKILNGHSVWWSVVIVRLIICLWTHMWPISHFVCPSQSLCPAHWRYNDPSGLYNNPAGSYYGHKFELFQLCLCEIMFFPSVWHKDFSKYSDSHVQQIPLIWRRSQAVTNDGCGEFSVCCCSCEQNTAPYREVSLVQYKQSYLLHNALYLLCVILF